LFCDAIREDHPLLLVYHVYEFLFKEVNVLVAALVGSSLNGSLELMFCPGFGSEFDRGSVTFVMLKEALGGVGEIGQVCEISSASS